MLRILMIKFAYTNLYMFYAALQTKLTPNSRVFMHCTVEECVSLADNGIRFSCWSSPLHRVHSCLSVWPQY